jgi:hypothetical protein
MLPSGQDFRADPVPGSKLGDWLEKWCYLSTVTALLKSKIFTTNRYLRNFSENRILRVLIHRPKTVLFCLGRSAILIQKIGM